MLSPPAAFTLLGTVAVKTGSSMGELVAASWDPGMVTGQEQGLPGDEREPRAPAWTLVCRAPGATCPTGPALLVPGRTAGAAAC